MDLHGLFYEECLRIGHNERIAINSNSEFERENESESLYVSF